MSVRDAEAARAAGAHRLPDGTFRNPWPGSAPHQWRDVVRWMGETLTKRHAPTPPRGTFPISRPTIAYPRVGDGEFTATWIGHSTVLLQIEGLNVLTDPVFSQRAFPVQWMGPRRVMDPGLPIEALPPIDAVVLSHNHYDHLDRPAVKQMTRAHPEANWVSPVGVGARIRGWGAREIIELDWWQHAVIDKLRVTAVPARHFSGRRVGDRNRSLWCGFAFDIEGRRALFAGDTAFHPAFSEIGARCGPFDLVMIPIGAYDPRWFMSSVHMNPEEAVQAYQDLIAPHPGTSHPIMLGVHWGTFRLTQEAMDEPPRRTLARWRAVGLDERRLWIARFGETRAVAHSTQERGHEHDHDVRP